LAPPLARNPRLGDDAYVLRKIAQGSAAMPPFGGQLSSAEIAAVVDFIRSQWRGH
jgi:mono/diheme cytochrome c family protein